jgi:hypothetical protein
MSKRLISHPMTRFFPRMSREDYSALRSDIQRHGLRVPIVLLEGKILDGRHRYQACLELSIEPDLVHAGRRRVHHCPVPQPAPSPPPTRSDRCTLLRTNPVRAREEVRKHLDGDRPSRRCRPAKGSAGSRSPDALKATAS